MVYPKRKGKTDKPAHPKPDDSKESDVVEPTPGPTTGTSSRPISIKPKTPVGMKAPPAMSAPPPKPRNTGHKELPLKNDPLQTDYVLGDEDIVFQPTMTLRRINIEFAQYQDLVEQCFVSLSAQSSNWSKMVLPSAFSLYANWHLYWRLIQLKKARGETLDADEDAFDTAFKDDGSLLPEPLVAYLKGIGPFKVKDREIYYPVPISLDFNAQGHYGQINGVNAINYATLAAPAMCVARLVHETNQAPQNFVPNWNFPAGIVPAQFNNHAGIPTLNCVGYRPLRRSRAEACGHWAALIGNAQDNAQVPSHTKFLYVPAIAADMKNQLGTTFGKHANPQSLVTDGSIVQGFTLMPAAPIVNVNPANNWTDTDFYLRSAECLSKELASAGILFGYRRHRNIAQHQRVSPVRFEDNQHVDAGVPANWMANANDYLNALNFGSRNQDMFRTMQINPLRCAQQWVSNHLQHRKV